MALTGLSYTFPTSSGYADYKFTVRNPSGEYGGVITYRGIDETLFVPCTSTDPGIMDEIPSGYYDFGTNYPEGLDSWEVSTHKIGFSFIYSVFSWEMFGKGICTNGFTTSDIGKWEDIRASDVRHNIKMTTVTAPAGYDWEG